MWIAKKIRKKFLLRNNDIVDICPFRTYFCKGFNFDALNEKWMKKFIWANYPYSEKRKYVPKAVL